METFGARKWSVVAMDRFEDKGDPFYPIDKGNPQYNTEEQAEEAARKYLSNPKRVRFSGGEDDLYIVDPAGKKRMFRRK